MKKVILSMVVIIAIVFTSCKNEAKKESNSATTTMSKEMAMKDISFGVRGNCGMCKRTIEKAANSVEGIANANWDKDKKLIKVSFDEGKTDVMSIHKAIAASGYDTEKLNVVLDAYYWLPGFCKWDQSIEMNQ